MSEQYSHFPDFTKISHLTCEDSYIAPEDTVLRFFFNSYSNSYKTDMQIEESIRKRFDDLKKMAQKDMGEALGLEYTVISRDEMIATMPVNENTIQPMGILHGGASVVLAETLSSIGAWLNLTDDTKIAVGLEINANHIKTVRAGQTVTGIAKPLHRGAQTQVWETRIETDTGKLVCISRCTIAIIKKKK